MSAAQDAKPARKALVVGGSLGGLFAANLLLRAGWDVQVHERVADELEGRGAGVVTHPELMEVLGAAGVDLTESIGVEVRERITLARDGRLESSRPLPQLLTAWGRLYQLLRRAFPSQRYPPGRQRVTLEQDDAGVRATFADGEVAGAELLVAADGLRSTVRQLLAPDARPRYAGYVAWRGLVDEASLSPRTHAALFPYFAFGLPPREQMIAYPVAGAGNSVEPGERRYNFVWYRPADQDTTLREMLTDASGKTWPDGIPPPLIRPEVVASARQAAHEVLAPQFAEVVQKTPNLFFQPIFDLESQALAFGRVALLGDAAFVARPHCGMGVTKAGSDAAALVRALEALPDVQSALKAYEAERLSSGSFIVA